MPNLQGPFGFSQIGTASGPVNFAESHNPPWRIAAGNTTPIFYGDAVRLNSTGPTGFLETWVVGDGATATRILVGIFVGCRYFSTSQRKMVWSNFWPGGDATGDVFAFIVDDPDSQFKVQAAAGPITQANIGQTVDIVATPIGSTVTGISGMSIGTPTTTATLPFKVVNIITQPPTANGTDITTAFNNVVVTMNNQQYKSLVGV